MRRLSIGTLLRLSAVRCWRFRLGDSENEMLFFRFICFQLSDREHTHLFITHATNVKTTPNLRSTHINELKINWQREERSRSIAQFSVSLALERSLIFLTLLIADYCSTFKLKLVIDDWRCMITFDVERHSRLGLNLCAFHLSTCGTTTTFDLTHELLLVAAVCNVKLKLDLNLAFFYCF